MGIISDFGQQELSDALSGRFVISGEIRRGGQAIVYRAVRRLRHDGSPSANEDVALKVHTNTSELMRADREVKALDGFEHPCLAQFVEYGDIELRGKGTRYVAWRFVDGVALDSRIAATPCAPKIVANIARDVSRAIAHIWQKRIVHRDINPKNIMLVRGETGAVLLDLGVARFLELSTITAAGMTWGTRGYFSPEQWNGDNLSCHSDVFSLGVTLQETLCGHHPTYLDQALLLNSPVRTSELCPSAPAALTELIDRCLILRPSFRPHPSFLEQQFANLAALF